MHESWHATNLAILPYFPSQKACFISLDKDSLPGLFVLVPAVYWWYRTASHAAELTAGYYNPTNQDGYSPVFEVLKKHSMIMKFVCSGLQVSGSENDEALVDPEGLSWQGVNELPFVPTGIELCFGPRIDSGWCKYALPVMTEKGIGEWLKWQSQEMILNTIAIHFVYQQPSPLAKGTICFPDSDYFIKCMHGEVSGDLISC